MIRKLLISTVLLLTLWLGGFTFFVYYTNSLRVSNTTTTDLIAVVTGGRGRIETSVKLLNAGYAPLVFIAGANPQDLKNYLTENKVNSEQLIYGQENTDINEKIKEIINFVNAHNIKSLRIVTSSYNMPRVIERTKELAPINLIIIAHPVLADYQPYNVLFKEYNEYLKTYFIDFIK